MHNMKTEAVFPTLSAVTRCKIIWSNPDGFDYLPSGRQHSDGNTRMFENSICQLGFGLPLVTNVVMRSLPVWGAVMRPDGLAGPVSRRRHYFV